MGTTSLPRINAQLLAAQSLVGAEPFRLLVVGQIGAAGTAVDGQAYQDVESLTDDEVKTLFGINSDLTNRILKARKVCQARFSIWVIGKTAAGGGTAATLSLAYSGAATEDRVMTIRPISQDQFSFNVAVTSGDTAEDVATAVKAGLDALEETFPATNSQLTATLTLTAADVGTIGNKYAVEHINIPAGITLNTNAESSRDQFSAGATDPTLTGIFDTVTAIRFHSIAWPWESDFSEVQDFLETRNVVNNQFLQGVAFIGFDDTEANIKAKVNGVTPLNSLNLFFVGNRTASGVSAFIEPSDWRVAEFCAIEGLRLTEDVPIGQYITTSAPLDAVGGPGSSSLAYYNTPLADTSPVNPDLLFDEQEQQNLGDDGYTIVGVNESASSAIMAELISTYKFNTRGEPDVSFKFLNYIRTSYLALEIFFKTLKSSYSQSRLTEGDVVAGRAMANKEAIEAEYTRIYKRLSSAEFALTQAGSAAESYFFKNLTITLDVANGKITSSGQLPIVTQVREFVMTFQLAFSIGG